MTPQYTASPWARTPESDCCPETGEYLWHRPWYRRFDGETKYGAVESIADRLNDTMAELSMASNIAEYGCTTEVGAWRMYDPSTSQHLWSAERDAAQASGTWKPNAEGVDRASAWYRSVQHRLTQPAKTFFEALLDVAVICCEATKALEEDMRRLNELGLSEPVHVSAAVDELLVEGIVDRLMLFARQFQLGMIRDLQQHPLTES